MSKYPPWQLRIYGGTQDASEDHQRPQTPGPLRISFERALANLEQLPRMFVELDGSFLWPGEGWQFEGTVYDDGLVVRYVHLIGNGPLAAWTDFLAALDESFTTISVELLDLQATVDGECLKQKIAIDDTHEKPVD